MSARSHKISKAKGSYYHQKPSDLMKFKCSYVRQKPYGLEGSSYVHQKPSDLKGQTVAMSVRRHTISKVRGPPMGLEFCVI